MGEGKTFFQTLPLPFYNFQLDPPPSLHNYALDPLPYIFFMVFGSIFVYKNTV